MSPLKAALCGPRGQARGRAWSARPALLTVPPRNARRAGRSRGALALSDGQWLEVPAVPAKLVDSNGAGDTFMVATWHAMNEGKPVAEALAFAARCAAKAVESEELVPNELAN